MRTSCLVTDAHLLLVAVATVLVALLDAVSAAQSISSTIKETTELAGAALVKGRASRSSDDHGEDKEKSEDLVNHC